MTAVSFEFKKPILGTVVNRCSSYFCDEKHLPLRKLVYYSLPVAENDKLNAS